MSMYITSRYPDFRALVFLPASAKVKPILCVLRKSA